MSYLDLLIGDLVCSIFGKENAFDFSVVNFPDLSGNIPAATAYGTYISQLIRNIRAYHNYANFSSWQSMLADRLLNQGFLWENWWEHSANLWVDIKVEQLCVIIIAYLSSVDQIVIGRVLCTRQGMLSPSDIWCHHWLTSRDVPTTNIRKEPCGGWMIVLFMVVSFVIGCVDWMCQLFLSGCVSFLVSTIVFGLVVVDFSTLPCL